MLVGMFEKSLVSCIGVFIGCPGFKRLLCMRRFISKRQQSMFPLKGLHGHIYRHYHKF
jgi:hypothetical protein